MPQGLFGFALAIVLGLAASVWAHEPGDKLQARRETKLMVDETEIATVPEGIVVTIEKVEGDRLWCWTPLGTGWLDPADLMTCEEGVKIFKQKVEDGDVDAYFHLAAAEDSLGDLKQAIADFDHYLQARPNSAGAIANRGFCWLKLGHADEAAKDFTAAILIAPDAAAYSNRANARLMLGDGKGAIADCVSALLLEPKNIFALVNRGSAQRLLGKYDAAVADYERALAIDDASYSAYRNYALLRGAAADDGFRNGRQAIELAEKACRATNHCDALSLSSLAVAYAETGDWEAAIRWQTAAIEHEKLAKNAAEHQLRLDLFKAHQPYRLKLGAPVPDD